MEETGVTIPIDLAQQIVELGRQLVPYLAVAPNLGSAADPKGVTIPGHGAVWTRQMLGEFRSAIDRYPAASAVFGFVAAHPDEEVRFSEVVSNTGASHNQLMAELAAVSKAARRVLGKKIWPMAAWQHADGETRYRMPAQIAAWWKEEGRS